MKSLAQPELPAVGVKLRATIEDVLCNHREHNLIVAGPDVSIRPATATRLEIALDELAVNAARDGALSLAAGQLSVTWRVEAARTPRVTLDWVESGVPRVIQPRDRFGPRLIRAVFDKEPEASAKLSFVPGGVMCRFVFQAC